MAIFTHSDFDQHENIFYANDEDTGLKAIIAIHNTNLGPALGGCRFWNYENEDDALTDALRLSKGMTYKAALAGLSLGGGKSVIIGDATKIKTPQLMQAFGRAIERLKGTYITAEDVGTTVRDMDEIRKSTAHVRGQSIGSGNPSPLTALGTFEGIKAAVRHQLKTDHLEDLRVLIQGVGHVGYHLCKYLHNAGAKLIISDINTEQLMRCAQEFNAPIVSPDQIFNQDADIYAPCALGATINDETIDRLKVSIIAGSANNQLAEDRHALSLKEKGILYAPDYVINAGGLINVAHENGQYSKSVVEKQVIQIGQTLEDIFQAAETKDKTTLEVANALAEKRFKHSSQIAAQ